MKRRLFLLLPFLVVLFPRKAKAGVSIEYKARLTGSNVLVPQIAIGWRITRTFKGTVLDDSSEGTGRSILFPDVIASLTAAEKRELFDHLAQWFVKKAQEKLQ